MDYFIRFKKFDVILKFCFIEIVGFYLIDYDLMKSKCIWISIIIVIGCVIIGCGFFGLKVLIVDFKLY